MQTEIEALDIDPASKPPTCPALSLFWSPAEIESEDYLNSIASLTEKEIVVFSEIGTIQELLDGIDKHEAPDTKFQRIYKQTRKAAYQAKLKIRDPGENAQ
jgi:hypothetical protein